MSSRRRFFTVALGLLSSAMASQAEACRFRRARRSGSARIANTSAKQEYALRAVRSMTMTVGGTPIDKGITYAYPDPSPTVFYKIPTYKMTVTGTTSSGASSSTDFEVFRFGVKKESSGRIHVVGLADAQDYVIPLWDPNYRVHSAASTELGAWQVTGNFLVHDGPDDPRPSGPGGQVYATVGCIELCGPAKFDALNDLLISLSGLTSGSRRQKLLDIGSSGNLKIVYETATRPPLEQWP